MNKSLIDMYVEDPEFGYRDLARKELELARAAQDRSRADGARNRRSSGAARMHRFKARAFEAMADSGRAETQLEGLRAAVLEMYSDTASDDENARCFAALARMVGSGMFSSRGE